MKFRPLHDRVLVRRIEQRRRPPAASSSPTPPRKSRRRAKSSPSAPAPANEDGKLTPLDVKAGDRILFGKWSGTEVKIDGEDLLIMKESRHPRHHRGRACRARRRPPKRDLCRFTDTHSTGGN